MKSLTKVLSVLACTFALSLTVGCGKDVEAVKSEYLAQIDKMCECVKDPANMRECQKPIKEALKKIEEENQDIPKEQQKEVEKAAKEKMAECMRAQLGGAGGAGAKGAAKSPLKAKK